MREFLIELFKTFEGFRELYGFRGTCFPLFSKLETRESEDTELDFLYLFFAI